MRSVTFSDGKEARIGVLCEGGNAILDLTVASPQLPKDMVAEARGRPARANTFGS